MSTLVRNLITLPHTGFDLKLGQIGLKWDNSGTFFQIISEKVPDFFPFGANLTHFEAKISPQNLIGLLLDAPPMTLLLMSSDHLVRLTIHHRQRDAELRHVVGQHHDLVGARDGRGEHIHGNHQVRHHEEHRADTAAQLRPGPQVVIELHPRHSPPRHRADQSDVAGSQVAHHSGQIGGEVPEHAQADHQEEQAGAEL